LNASPIDVPPLRVEYLERGHAVHFRCPHPEAASIRVDLISKMRGVDSFEGPGRAAQRWSSGLESPMISFRFWIWCARRKPSATRTGP
jgi:hypothetical protein